MTRRVIRAKAVTRTAMVARDPSPITAKAAVIIRQELHILQAGKTIFVVFKTSISTQFPTNAKNATQAVILAQVLV